ncbi:MAG: toll/interleukin-1 receptor domain-containing protein, partial [Acidimicrobiales bacterium]
MPAAPLIFVSHSTRDAPVGEALVELLRAGANVPQERIVFTSAPGTDIPAGQEFTRYLRDRLQGTALFIQLISAHYLQSPFCMCELGAQWALETDSFPLLVP